MLYHNFPDVKGFYYWFPSPSRGLFFHNATEEAAAKWRAVSVPFSGLSFLLSVKKWQPENLDQMFPSPSWGLVFIQPLKLKIPPKNLWFSSPTWGLVFMLWKNMKHHVKEVSVPCLGLIFLCIILVLLVSYRIKCFRPLLGAYFFIDNSISK